MIVEFDQRRLEVLACTIRKWYAQMAVPGFVCRQSKTGSGNKSLAECCDNIPLEQLQGADPSSLEAFVAEAGSDWMLDSLRCFTERNQHLGTPTKIKCRAFTPECLHLLHVEVWPNLDPFSVSQKRPLGAVSS